MEHHTRTQIIRVVCRIKNFGIIISVVVVVEIKILKMAWLLYAIILSLCILSVSIDQSLAKPSDVRLFNDRINLIFSKTGEPHSDEQLSQLIDSTRSIIPSLSRLELKVAQENIIDMNLLESLRTISACDGNDMDLLGRAISKFGIEYKSLNKFLLSRQQLLASKCQEIVSHLVESSPHFDHPAWNLFLPIVHQDSPVLEYLLGDTDDAEKVVTKAFKKFLLSQSDLVKPADMPWNQYKNQVRNKIPQIYISICANTPNVKLLDILPYTLYFDPAISVIGNFDREISEKVEKLIICEYLTSMSVTDVTDYYLVNTNDNGHIFDLVFARGASNLMPDEVEILLEILTSYDKYSDEGQDLDIQARKRSTQLMMIPTENPECSLVEASRIRGIWLDNYSANIKNYYLDNIGKYKIQCLANLAALTTESLANVNYIEINDIVAPIHLVGTSEWGTNIEIQPLPMYDGLASYLILKGLNMVNVNQATYFIAIESLVQFCHPVEDRLKQLHKEFTKLRDVFLLLEFWPHTKATDLSDIQKALLTAYNVCNLVANDSINVLYLREHTIAKLHSTNTQFQLLPGHQ